MAYNDKYKKILDEVWKDKVELDGKIVKEDEEAVKRIKGEALKEKDDPRAFIFPIRLEGQVNENELADTGSDINTMPFCIYVQLGRDDMKKVDRGITMINHTQAEAMGILTNVLCQVGVTTLIAKFLILDILIDRDSPIVVGRGFLRTIGGIVNTPERLFSTFDGFCHQTFRAARSDVMRNAESDSDDKEEYQIKRNKFGAPIYGPKPAPYLSLPLKQVNWKPDYKGSYTKEEEATGQWRTEIRLKEHTIMRPGHQDPNAQDNMKPWKKMGCDGVIDDMLRIRFCEVGSDEEIFTSVAWIRAFNINEPIYVEICHEFYSTYEFDEECANDELQSKKIIKFETLTLRDFDPTLMDLYDRMGRMEIRQEAIERMKYRQTYHWDRVMDPNSSLGKICLGENDWEKKAMVFYQMDIEEVRDSCAWNMKLKEEKIVKKELIVALRAITDFWAGTVTIYPDIDPFLEESEEEGKRNDDWDHLLDFNIDDVPLLGEEGLPPFVCKMGKSSHNKKWAMENFNFFSQDIGISSSAGGHLTQEEAAKEAISIRMSRNFALLEEERPIIETMAYNDKYKKILNEI
ncbi:hypothetical protein Tco_1410649 [Tanacetum coccineum]